MFEQSVSLILSGGGANQAPVASLGGQRSVQAGAVVFSQGVSPASPFSGVTLVEGRGHTTFGTATLTYNATTKIWTYTPPGGVTTSMWIPASGRCRIGANPCLILDVVVGDLPGTNQSVPISVFRRQHNLFDPVSYSERLAGRTEYRCVYVQNTCPVRMEEITIAVSPGAGLGTVTLSPGSTTTQWSSVSAVQAEAQQLKRWNGPIQIEATLGTQQGNVFRLGAPFYGAAQPVVAGADGDGITSAVAAGPLLDEVDSTAVLAGYAWSSSVTMGSIEAGNVRPLWLRRQLPANAGSAQIQEAVGLQISYRARG